MKPRMPPSGTVLEASPGAPGTAPVPHPGSHTDPHPRPHYLPGVQHRRTPRGFVFEEKDRGKTVCFAMQWQNGKGEKGKPGEIQWAIVP